MYVNSHGVVEQDPRPNQSLEPWPQPGGHPVLPQQRVSRISKLNSTLASMLLLAVLVSSGLAVAVRSDAQAAMPASVSGFGKAQPLGNPEVRASDEVTAIASSPKAEGYWTVTREGKVTPFGNVPDLGGLDDSVIADIVDIESTKDGQGYWLMASSGNIYTYGTAKFHGTPEQNGEFGKTFVKILPTSRDNGYLLVEGNGAVSAFGDAKDQGSATSSLIGDSVVDARATPSGDGYVMLSVKGAVFAFGDAYFYGAVNAGQLTDTATAIAFSEDAMGYWILTQNGQVLPYGDAQSFGNSAEPNRTGAPSIDLAIHRSGEGYWIATGKNDPVPPAPKSGQIVAKTANQVAVPTVQANIDTSNSDIWAALRNCEAGGVYSRNSGNGYYGAYQFSAGTWRSMGTGYEFAHLAPPEVQDDAARRLQARSGWGQWPACSKKIGVR